VIEGPIHKLGHIACGNSVCDSQEFKDFLLLKRDRKYIAIEMESSGVAEGHLRYLDDHIVVEVDSRISARDSSLIR
jgi:hypothetical protein